MNHVRKRNQQPLQKQQQEVMREFTDLDVNDRESRCKCNNNFIFGNWYFAMGFVSLLPTGLCPEKRMS